MAGPVECKKRLCAAGRSIDERNSILVKKVSDKPFLLWHLKHLTNREGLILFVCLVEVSENGLIDAEGFDCFSEARYATVLVCLTKLVYRWRERSNIRPIT